MSLNLPAVSDVTRLSTPRRPPHSKVISARARARTLSDVLVLLLKGSQRQEVVGRAGQRPGRQEAVAALCKQTFGGQFP